MAKGIHFLRHTRFAGTWKVPIQRRLPVAAMNIKRAVRTQTLLPIAVPKS